MSEKKLDCLFFRLYKRVMPPKFIAGFLSGIISLTLHAQQVTLDELQTEYQKQWKDALGSGDPAQWRNLAGWIERQKAIAGENEKIRSALWDWSGNVQGNLIAAELRSLKPEDRDGLTALADKFPKGEATPHPVREALENWLKTHPHDDAIYQRCLEGLKDRQRASANFAKSDGLLTISEREKSPELFFKAGKWHETIPQREMNQAPIRAIQCYLRAIRLAPAEAGHRTALDDWLARAIPKSPDPADLQKVPESHATHSFPIDHRPSIKWVENTRKDDEQRQGKGFKVKSGEKISYQKNVPTSPKGLDCVWELRNVRAWETAGMGGFDSAGYGSALMIAKDTQEWAPLKWDKETSEWVAYPKMEDRERMKKNIGRMRGKVEEFKKSIGELEPQLSALLQPKNLGDCALQDISEKAEFQEVNSFYHNLLGERSKLDHMMDTLQSHRASIPAFEKKIKELETELAQFEKIKKLRKPPPGYLERSWDGVSSWVEKKSRNIRKRFTWENWRRNFLYVGLPFGVVMTIVMFLVKKSRKRPIP